MPLLSHGAIQTAKVSARPRAHFAIRVRSEKAKGSFAGFEAGEDGLTGIVGLLEFEYGDRASAQMVHGVGINPSGLAVPEPLAQSGGQASAAGRA